MGDVGRAIDFPTREDIVNLNRSHIQQSGGLFSGQDNLRRPDSLVWVLEAIQYPLSGVDLYPTLAEKAAILAWVIIQGHVFHDGCKRTGISAAEALIESAGFCLTATNAEIVEVALRVAQSGSGSGFTYEDLVQWVRNSLSLAD